MTDNIKHRPPDVPTIGWFCTYTPEEIIIAAGLRGRRIMGSSTAMAKADSYLHPNLCAYVRACLSSVLLAEPDDLAGIIMVDSCDAMRRLFDTWRHFLSPGFSHMLALPHRQTLDAAQFYAAELRKLIESLGEHFGQTISAKELRHGIETMNETRSLLRRLSELRHHSPVLSGGRFYEIVREAMVEPKEEFNSRYRSQLETLEKAGGRREPTTEIVLTGGLLDDTWIINAIEEAGAQVIADDLCCGSRYFDGLVSTQEEPLLAIAKRYVFRNPCPRMCATEARINGLLDLIEKSEAKGLIYYSVKFCDTHMLDWVPISRTMQEAGIPTLRCETDYSASERERMKVRIEAFLEMIKEDEGASRTGACVPSSHRSQQTGIDHNRQFTPDKRGTP